MSKLISFYRTTDADFPQQLKRLLAYEAGQDVQIEQSVAQIIAQVRERGDAAVLEYTQRFDGSHAKTAADFEVSLAVCQAAFEQLPAEQREALLFAAQRIRTYHEHQVSQNWSFTDEYGNTLGQRITPLDRVGLYVPGGKASYPSSVLMNAIPAKVAGVQSLIMVTPAPDHYMNPMVLAAAHVAQVDRVFTVGGAQAVAALAYGTETIPAVDKIVGPGNAYVAEAKRRVFGQVGIDMIAGPSEILIIADGSVPAHWMATDLFSQAEHDELAQAILLCPDEAYLQAVEAAITELLPQQPRQAILEQSLKGRGALIHVRSIAEACEIANQIAPEHLELAMQDAEHTVQQIRHAGAIFVGGYTSESLGDYCAGTNHVLPTFRTARFSSPLGVYDFQKRTSVLQVSREGAQVLGKYAGILADSEQLAAHAQSARLRLE